MPRRAPALSTCPSARPSTWWRSGLNSVDLLAVVDGHPAADAKTEMLEFAQLPGGQSASAAVGAGPARLRGALHRPGRRRRLRPAAASRACAREGVDVSRVIDRARRDQPVRGHPRRSRRRHAHRHLAPPPRPGDVARRHPGPRRSPTPACCHGRLPRDGGRDRCGRRDARRAGARTVVDVERVRPGIDALLRQIDVIIAAEAFPAGVHRPAVARSGPGGAAGARPAPRWCASTLGAEGSLARAGGREFRTPAFRVPVVDTTGAGDVFRAGFIAGWLAGGDRRRTGDGAALGQRRGRAQVPGPRRARPPARPVAEVRGAAGAGHVTLRQGPRSKRIEAACHAGRCFPRRLAARRQPR